MPSEQDTVVNTETVSDSVNGSLAGEQSADTSVANQGVTQDAPQTSDELDKWRKAAEEAQKERDQARQRANQLENERKEAERKRLEEANEYKTLYEQKLAEDEARKAEEEAAKAAQTAKELRDSVIDAYPDEKVKAAAKKLTTKNDSYFYWGENVQSEDDARAAVKAQLDDLASEFGTPASAEQDVMVDANNPIEGRTMTPESLEAMEKRLENYRF